MLNIFLEYAPGGSIKAVLNMYGPFSESVIRRCGPALSRLASDGV